MCVRSTRVGPTHPMAHLTASMLAALRRVHVATTRRWIAEARRSPDAYPVEPVEVVGGNGARITAYAIVVPDDVVALWRREAEAAA